MVVGRVEGTEPDNPGGGTTDPEQPTEIPRLTNGNTTCTLDPNEWTNQNVIATITTTVTGYTLQTSKNGSEWTNTKSQTFTTNGTIYARLTDGTRTGEQVSYPITNIDKTAPTITIAQQNVTTNSITVKVTATDNESGMPTNPIYKYYIRKSTEATYVEKASTTSSSYIFNGLTQTTSYDIKVTTLDNVGNEGTGTALNKTTGTVSNGTETGAITFGSQTWSSGKASVTISTSTSYSIEYQKNSISETWTSITNGGTVGELNNGDTVYARLTDGINHGDYASVTVIDNLSPQDATITLSSQNTTTGESVTATVTHTDNESGIVITNCRWVYNTTATNIGTTVSDYTGGSFSSNGQFISLSTTTADTYYLHVLSVDSAGNKTETISGAITISQPTIDQATSYVGYYADFEGDGTVDGVIYADLKIGGSGRWNDSVSSYDEYTIMTVDDVKDYYVSGTGYVGPFGTKDVLSPMGIGKDRFYVMALTDFDEERHYWYASAYRKISDYSTTTSEDFGTGKTNTETMITKWNASSYGAQDDLDMWGVIQDKVNEGWFVPSRAEWAAFGNAFSITSDNYDTFGLSNSGDYYWSSSLNGEDVAFEAIFGWSYMGYNELYYGNLVRLSATF